MKHNDFETIQSINTTDMANLFNVYENKDLGSFELTYAINRTFNFEGLDNINKKYYNNYIVRSVDTWLSISFDQYDTNRLWWLVCKMNKVNNPLESPVEGDTIKILKRQYIDGLLELLELS